MFGHFGRLSWIGFDGRSGQGPHGLDDGRWRELEIEIRDLEIVEGLAVAGKLELARDEAGLFQFLQVKMQQGAADPDLAGELADIVAPVRLQRRQDPQTVRTGERRQDGEQLISGDGQVEAPLVTCKKYIACDKGAVNMPG